MNLEELVAALEKSDVLQGYVDTETGKVVLFGHEFSESGKNEESEDERLEHVFSIEDQWQRYVALPNIHDSDEIDIMHQFAAELEDVASRKSLLDVLQGHGAVTRFAYQIKRLALQAQWKEYFHCKLRAIACDWCEENDVAYEE